jgi:adenylyl- and sulfurtransferase ThiI
VSAELLAELERLHSRADEARHKAARAEAAAEHKRAELSSLLQTLREEFGVESLDEADKVLAELEESAEQAVAAARDLINSEGILNG